MGALSLILSLGLTSCATGDEAVLHNIDIPAVSPAARSTASAPLNNPPAEAPVNTDRVLFKKVAVPAAVASSAGPSTRDVTLQLNFVNTRLSDVARAVVAEALGETLSIPEPVAKTVTLTSSAPVAAADALKAVETLVAESGYAIVKTDVGYSLTPLTKAAAETVAVRPPSDTAFGYGLTVVPLQNSSAANILQLIKPVQSQRVTVTADDARRLLFLRGPQPDVAATLEAIELFDVDWIARQNVALFKARQADAVSLKEEIEAILSTSSGYGVAPEFDLIALPRINALLLATPNKSLFDEASQWITRLDQPIDSEEIQLHYYKANYKQANELATSLSAAFGGSVAPSSAPGASKASGPDNPGGASGFTSSIGGPAAKKSAPQLAPLNGNSEISIVPDEPNNALIIRASARNYRQILSLLERMDTPSPQVLIEATIVEVRLTDDLRYGVRWFLEGGKRTGVDGDSFISRGGFSDLEDGAVGAQFPGLGFTYANSGIQASLDLLSSVTDVDVLSAPKLLVINNQSASLQVGDEVPIVTQISQGVGAADAPIVSNVELRDTGVILEITPRINASDVIVLEVSQEVSDATQTTTSGIDTPTIQQRRFSSTVAVKNGDTIALGGIIRENRGDTEVGVPVLKDIPVAGNAFKSRSKVSRRTELMVFLTPRIILDAEDGHQVLRDLRDQMGRLKVRVNEDRPEPQ